MANDSTQTSPGTAKEFQPTIPDSQIIPEFTLRAILLGSVLGIIFGASSLYLVLKVGMTVSASIPVAVLSISLFRHFGKMLGSQVTILEHNIVQTAGSAGESIAFGIGVTMPALMLLGFEMSISRIMFVSFLGGILGILMMIPLRRTFIVKLHGTADEPGKLVYPEGTACAEVLRTGESQGVGGVYVFLSFTIAFIHKLLTEGFKLFSEMVSYPLASYHRTASIDCALQSELLGVGYVIGIRTAGIMVAGGVIGNLVLIPLIAQFGDQAPNAIAPATDLIANLDTGKISGNYLRYIGAGCVTMAGFLSLFKVLPTIFRSAVSSFSSIRQHGGGDRSRTHRRTEQDLPMQVVYGGSLALLAILLVWLIPEMGFFPAALASLLVLVFGFLFVLVSSRLTGEIGSSSNPISGMTIATLTLTCACFLALNMISPQDRVLALTIGAIVCVAASNGGTTSQDLKTGYLVGATPKYQQLAIIIGATSSALVLASLLMAFNAAGTKYIDKDLPSIDLTGRLELLTETETYQGETFHVWRPTPDEVPPGRQKFLVDKTGRVRYLVDPAILSQRAVEKDEEGNEIPESFRFSAPKTQVIGIIINGILDRRLNWTLILIGAFLAIAIELAGLSALAFAVGVYIPLGYSTPIYLGGLVGWIISKVRGSKNSASDEEVSPGMMTATGLIAGGSLGGVASTFLYLNPSWEKTSEGLSKVLNSNSLGNAQLISSVVFLGLASYLLRMGLKRGEGKQGS